MKYNLTKNVNLFQEKTKKYERLINEIIEKSKIYEKDFLPPKEFKIKISELENYDEKFVAELSVIEETLIDRKGTYKIDFAYSKTFTTPIVRIVEDYLVFFPSVIKKFKIKNKL